MTTDSDTLAELARSHPGWRFWRGKPSHGRASTTWVATLLDPAVGVTPTLIENTPEALLDQVETEARRAAAGGTCLPQPDGLLERPTRSD